MTFNINELLLLTKLYTQTPVAKTEAIAQSGSHRVYTRLFLADGSTLMGAFNNDIKENEAFFSFTHFFLKEKINVPKILIISNNRMYYLLEDLGDELLLSFLNKKKKELATTETPVEAYNYFQDALRQLIRMQLCGHKDFDFSKCYPCDEFGAQAMQWDLNYFKYFFLKLAYIPFDEQALENDFQTLINFLLEAEHSYFMFRDFQSRNIMIHNNQLYFIDYQGGRKGALQYDVSSLLFQAKAGLSSREREDLLNFYLDELSHYQEVDHRSFQQHYYGYVLIRVLQTLGAYGYRGYYERKSHFLQSIPLAVDNIRYLLENDKIALHLPELTTVLHSITARNWAPTTSTDGRLTVVVSSFSYKKGIPQDESDNGGGFVFDCRALPNPGREPQYKHSTGKDREVIEYLERYPEVTEFKQLTCGIVDMSVDNYLERHFTHLCVNCGCTGGQHRSVYFAQSIADHLREKYPDVNVVLHHREQEK